MSHDSLSEKILDKKPICDTDFLNVEIVSVELPNGHPATREVVRHPGAAAVFAVDDQDNVLLVRQYRTAFERILTEIPAGKLSVGEDPLECAQRELAEETGVTATSWKLMTSMATAAGFCDEIIHIYLARDLTVGVPHPDEDEFVEVSWEPYDQLLSAIVNNKLIDSKTVAATLLFEALRKKS